MRGRDADRKGETEGLREDVHAMGAWVQITSNANHTGRIMLGDVPALCWNRLWRGGIAVRVGWGSQALRWW